MPVSRFSATTRVEEPTASSANAAPCPAMPPKTPTIVTPTARLLKSQRKSEVLPLGITKRSAYRGSYPQEPQNAAQIVSLTVRNYKTQRMSKVLDRQSLETRCDWSQQGGGSEKRSAFRGNAGGKRSANRQIIYMYYPYY